MVCIMISERDITKQIRDYLRLRNVLHWKQHQGLGSTPGVPDIVGILKGGRFLGIEVKTEKGQLNNNQSQWINAINSYGGLAFVARSVDDVIKQGI